MFHTGVLVRRDASGIRVCRSVQSSELPVEQSLEES